MSQWRQSNLKGSYVSADGRFTAELRPAGYYSEFECRMVRHYAIRVTGSHQIIGNARTLKIAAAKYL